METKTLDSSLAAKNTATDAAYIVAQTSSGETVKIAKADLATVVAGLLSSETRVDGACYLYRNGKSRIFSSGVSNISTQTLMNYVFTEKDRPQRPLLAVCSVIYQNSVHTTGYIIISASGAMTFFYHLNGERIAVTEENCADVYFFFNITWNVA